MKPDWIEQGCHKCGKWQRFKGKGDELVVCAVCHKGRKKEYRER